MSPIKVDTVTQKQLESRGITEKTGVFGEHTVQLGTSEPIRLDSIKANKVPFQGFTTATKVARGQAGITASAQDTLSVLARPGQLDAKALMASLKTAQDYITRLDKLGHLTPQQKENALWAFAPVVENMSNAELAAVYQSFNTGEMDLLQTALLREGQINDKAEDARNAASLLFDLQALVLKEVSNRATRGMVEDLIAAHPEDRTLTELRMPPRLTDQYGGNAFVVPAQPHDISSANLLSLVETAAQSATTREKSAVKETERLRARDLPSVSVKEMADVLRSSELTINIDTNVLLMEDGIMAHPDEPIKNIFHLAEKNVLPKGEGYIARRDTAERLLFPELEGHAVQADERPVYGALNVQKRRIGAVSATAGYGTAAIVLKSDVARRATYIAEDTFFAPVLNMSQDRRTTFYTLLDGANLPAEFTMACRDANSPEHLALEEWFNTIAEGKDLRASAFNNLPSGIVLTNEDDIERFKGVLLQAFGDKSATRSLLATHDNLEALIPHMGDFDGNALALAAMKHADGSQPRLYLAGSQYIEAQIHGPLIPSRDIAEIRIDISDVPREDQAQVRARLAAFEKRTGIHVNIIENYDLGTEVTGINRTYTEERTFQLSHLDRAAIQTEAASIRRNLPEYLAAFIESKGIGKNLTPGMLQLEGNALALLSAKFEQTLREHMKTASQASLDPRELVEQAFSEAAMPILRRKVELLTELEKLHFETDAQKAAFAHWVCSAKALRSPEELRIIHTYATAHAEMLKGILNADPAPSAEDVFRRTGALVKQASKDLSEFIAGLGDVEFGIDDKSTELDRISFMSLALLQHGDPALDADGMKRLQERLNSPDQYHLMLQFGMLGMRGAADEAMTKTADFSILSATLGLMQRNATNTAGSGVSFAKEPDFTAELSLISQSARLALHDVAPETAAVLDRSHPAYPAFPPAAHPEAMPADGKARRDFLISNLDAYINHEKTFELGTSVHGRGHIARAFIFASAMCSILESQGVVMDRNAVLCGITGHDLGRQGRGSDQWEARSADMTVASMKKSFGADAMGEDYENAIRESIDSHKGQTLEAMLLNAADSLDIGRTQQFNPDQFAFLRGKDGEKPTAEAEAIRAQLAVEANLLQILTNPLCRNRNVMDKLIIEAATASGPIAEKLMRQRRELSSDIAAKFTEEWNDDSETFMQKIEKTIQENPDLFPLLSKYYRP